MVMILDLRQFINFHYEAKLCILCIVSGFRNKDAPFVSLLSFDCSDKVLTCLKACLRNPGTYRPKIVRLSSAQFVVVMFFVQSLKKIGATNDSKHRNTTNFLS